MAGDFTEVTNESWLSRISGALSGVLFGLGMLGGTAFLVYWNEGRTIRTAQALEEGAGIVVSVESTQVEPHNAGKLIHFSDETKTSETLADPEFAISANTIKLRRKVEMYQWHEKKTSHTEKQLGGGTKTTTKYTYEKKWKSSPMFSRGSLLTKTAWVPLLSFGREMFSA